MSLFSPESSFPLAEVGTKNNVLIEHISAELWWLWEQVRAGCTGCSLGLWESLWHELVLCQTPFLALWVLSKSELKIQEEKKTRNLLCKCCEFLTVCSRELESKLINL